MKIQELDKINSTQIYLLDMIKNQRLGNEICIFCKSQESGIGSRGNTWHNAKEGLYFSFALHFQNLPSDLKIQSASIYFGFLFKQKLRELGSKAWLKWPNDIYLDSEKIGGVICSVCREFVVCGIGLNLSSNSEFKAIERVVADEILKNRVAFLEQFLHSVKSGVAWGEVFTLYKKEFDKNFSYKFHAQDFKKSLKNAILQEDGSIILDGEILYSSR